MTSNIVNFPIIPRATAIAPEDESDPHTTAIRKIKEALQFSTQKCGNAWTRNVLTSLLEFDDSNGWRKRAREMITPKESV
jgi:hypothetical protein